MNQIGRALINKNVMAVANACTFVQLSSSALFPRTGREVLSCSQWPTKQLGKMVLGNTMTVKLNMRKLRFYSILIVTILTLSGAFFHFSWGTLSSFGYEAISAVCPLAFLETTLASHTFIPHLLIGLGVTLVVTLLLGRVFCAWACPIPYVKSWFAPRKILPVQIPSEHATTGSPPLRPVHVLRTVSPPSPPARPGSSLRYYVLGGVLLSSGIFGFPVFCLICPIGLFFGTLFALMRLLRFNEPTILLLVFPIMLILELTLLRNWCGKFCPIGAVLSLISRFNKTFLPHIDKNSCLTTSRGLSCHACQKVCPEDIDLHKGSAALESGLCTKCGDCADVCPASAIHFFQKEKSNVMSDKPMQKAG
jgi:ferredoxin-type protein NapH